MKSHPRIFIDTQLKEELIVETSPQVSHYLISAMRLKQGSLVTLFNGNDGEWVAKITLAHRRQSHLQILHQRHKQPSPPRPITLCFAPLKKSPTDFLIQKATELGVTYFQPTITERTQSEKIKPERLNAQIIEATEQCERLDLPKLLKPLLLDELLSQRSNNDLLLYGHERGQGQPIGNILSKGTITQNIFFLIGPEGGFSESEFKKISTSPYTQAMSLGPRILRAETAALVAIAAFQTSQGDGDQFPRIPSETTFKENL